MFSVGDIVICIDNGYSSAGYHYLNRLTIGKQYTVEESGYRSITILDDKGNYACPFEWRFQLAEDVEVISPVVRKIRQMEEKRKSLGYRW